MKNRTIKTRSYAGLTLVEMIIAMAVMAIIFSAIVPQFAVIRKSWDSKQASAETLQNGRVLIDHLNYNLAKAVKITAVSDSSETNGYIQFVGNDRTDLRYQIASGYVQFGPVGDLSDLAGPVSQLQFTCYDPCDLDAPITDTASVRSVKVEVTLTNSAALGCDKTLITTVYLRTRPSPMYWTDGGAGRIQTANRDGSGLEDLATGLNGKISGIALDLTAGKMYWIRWDRIRRANLDGSGIEDLATGLEKGFDIDLDVSAGKMYWTDFGGGKKSIQRANVDGTSIEDLVTGLNEPQGIAVDVAAGKIYWTDSGAGKIQRANLDGSSIEDLATGLNNKIKGITLDPTGGKMYWIRWDRIRRANLDGSGIEDLVTGLSKGLDICLDITAGRMYWTDFGTTKISRAALDGSGTEDLLTGLSDPKGIALDDRILP